MVVIGINIGDKVIYIYVESYLSEELTEKCDEELIKDLRENFYHDEFKILYSHKYDLIEMNEFGPSVIQELEKMFLTEHPEHAILTGYFEPVEEDLPKKYEKIFKKILKESETLKELIDGLNEIEEIYAHIENSDSGGGDYYYYLEEAVESIKNLLKKKG